MEKILVAQSKHETADWSSSLFRNYNSLFGMKVSKQIEFPGKVGPVSPEGDNYASYDRTSDSAQHLLNWLRARKIQVTTDPAAYVRAIRDKGYFTDTYENYLNGVNRFL